MRHFTIILQAVSGESNFVMFILSLYVFRSESNNQSLPNLASEDDSPAWECVWRCKTAAPVTHMAFSPDGTLFATAGNNDRLVKIWFENKHCKLYLFLDLISYVVH